MKFDEIRAPRGTPKITKNRQKSASGGAPSPVTALLPSFCENMSELGCETPFLHYLTALSGCGPPFLQYLTAFGEVSVLEKTTVAIAFLLYLTVFSRFGP